MPNIFDKLRKDGIDPTDPKKVAEALGVDYAEATKKATDDTRDGISKALKHSKTPETTNTFPKPGMTSRDIKVMEKIKSKDEKEFNRLMNVLEYHDEYIQITLPNSGILKIDRRDFGEMQWQEAMDKAESLGLRVLSIEELEELPDFVGLENCREIFSLAADFYWSSTTNASNTSSARTLYFSNALTFNLSKTNSHRVICTR